jgi:alpha-tubulin suppressor-like RCC1 family protein
LLILLIGALSACPTEPPVVATVELSPSTVTLAALGEPRQLAALARDANGTEIRGKRFRWGSMQPTVATIDSVTGVATAVANGTTTITATTDGVTGRGTLIVAQVGAQLGYLVQPSNATAGQALAPAVQLEVRDARGNRVAGATDAVSMSLGANPGGGTLSGTKTVNAVDGVAAFGDLSIERAGTGYSLVASSGPLTAGTSAGFNIGPASPAQLGFTTQPSNSQAGTAINPAVAVAVQDAFGNTVTSATDAVTIAIGTNPGSASLFGTTSVVAEAGVARFSDLSIDKAASGYALTASSGTLQGATSGSFTVVAGPLAQLVFTAQPAGNVEGNVQFPASVDVGLRDQFDNVVPTGQVTLGLGANPWAAAGAAGGTLTGTLSVAAVDGVAHFVNLRVDKPGAGYTLRASAGGIVLESSPFHVGLTFQQISRGLEHTCAVTLGGGYCWGSNVASKLGSVTGSTFSDSVPALVKTNVTFVQLVAGLDHTCGVTPTGAAYCWGANDSGQVGNGNHQLALEPARVVAPTGVAFVMLSAGLWHTCGLTTSGATYCWGANGDGQLGDGSNTSTASPVLASGGVSFAAVLAGGWHTCGVMSGGTAYCWGRNSSGQLGDSTTTSRAAPVLVKVPAGVTFEAIAAGQNHTCGLASGAAYCWGSNGAGQLGDGTAQSDSAPAPVTGGHMFTLIALGGFHSCARDTGGSLYCWGNGLNGELGNGFNSNSDSPTLVSGGYSFDVISLGGGTHTCARAVSPSPGLLCWGGNGAGELGDGTRVGRSEPVRVVQ